MKKYFFVLMLLSMMWVGCNEPEITDRNPVVRTYEDDKFRVSFWLETSEGEKATVFKQGEDIVMHYTVENLTSDSVYIAQTHSLPSNNPNFGTVFRQSDDKMIACPHFVNPAEYILCKHYEPGLFMNDILSFPKDFMNATGSQHATHLEKGNYYLKFQPRLGYNEYCQCPNLLHTKTAAEEVIVRLNLPEFRIDFEVK